MGFLEAIKAGWANWSNFGGRALRSEYWWFFVFALAVGLVANLLDMLVFAGNNVRVTSEGTTVMTGMSSRMISPISLIATLIILVPLLAVSVRRLHDIDRSGWWVLLFMIPFIAYLWFGYSFMGTYAAQQVAAGVTPTTVPWQATAVSIASLLLLIASIWLIVYYVRPGTPGVNRFGPPRAETLVPGVGVPPVSGSGMTRF